MAGLLHPAQCSSTATTSVEEPETDSDAEFMIDFPFWDNWSTCHGGMP